MHKSKIVRTKRTKISVRCRDSWELLRSEQLQHERIPKAIEDDPMYPIEAPERASRPSASLYHPYRPKPNTHWPTRRPRLPPIDGLTSIPNKSIRWGRLFFRQMIIKKIRFSLIISKYFVTKLLINFYATHHKHLYKKAYHDNSECLYK